jgi:hypothetical protein
MVDIYRCINQNPGNTHSFYSQAIHILFYSSWNFLQNRSYFKTQSKFQHIKENWNNPLHHIRSQQNKARIQQQKKPLKIFKHMETEEHSHFYSNKNENTDDKYLSDRIKDLLRGKVIIISAYFKKQRPLK